MSCLRTEDLQRLTRGELPRDEALAARRHLTACSECSKRLDEVEVHRAPERRLGRYVMLDELGRGGMGSVVRAFDPQLERFVAIKRLLEEGADLAARDRLVREAQAMARLVDPHLVSVFDAGLDANGEVYLVMEYVKGPTLSQWLTEGPRGWKEILELFGQAGRGLLAAHAAGLVHRDFKPSNVLVQNGVAKVTDFGLALSSGLPEGKAGGAEPSGVSSRVTRAGVNAGTPAYMAPEQFEGRFDARSDQFSFARSVEESLRDRGAPRWVHEALRRALEVDPSARYPSLTALLETLSVKKRNQRTTTVWLVAAAMLTFSVGGALVRLRKVDCSVAARPLEAVWTPSARAALHTSLSGVPLTTGAAIEAAFAQWGASWSERSQASCEASASGAQGARVELLRRACLERRLAFFATVLGQVESGAVLGERLVVVAEGLPAVDCTDEALLESGASDEPEALRAQLQPVRIQLDEVEALTLLGKLSAATARAREALSAARAVNHAPVVAEGAVLLGQRLALTEPGPAQRLFEEAYQLAAGVRVPTQITANVAARASLELLDSYVTNQPTFEALRPVVEAAITRAGGGEAWQAAYLMYLGRSLSARGEFEDALVPVAQSYELRLSVGGPDSERTEVARSEYALALENAGKLEEALGHRVALWKAAERRYGPGSVATARALASLGAAEVVAVKYAEARQHLQTAAAVLTAAGETEELVVVLDNLASLAELRGDFAGAWPLREQLLLQTKRPLLRGKQLALASRVLLELGQSAEAKASALECQALLSAVSETQPDLIVALTTLGRLTGGAEGIRWLQRALALESAQDGEYRGDAELAMARLQPDENARRAWLRKARASYAEGEVEFRVAAVDALLRP